MSGTGQELAGKVAVVTGASRRSGRATALKLAQHGAAVVVNARSAGDEHTIGCAQRGRISRRCNTMLRYTEVFRIFLNIAINYFFTLFVILPGRLRDDL